MSEFDGKKLLILGGNAETAPLVEVANGMGVKTIVSSARKTDVAKKYAWKAYDIDGMDVDGLEELAKEEKIDGVLVGVADILVPAYCNLCKRLNMPCYATKKIVDTLSFKDNFKAACEKYGIKGIPEYQVSETPTEDEIRAITFPVMVKPVDNGGGVGMSVCYNAEELASGIKKALDASKKKRYIVERYMNCEDIAIYFTFKDGECSASCIFDRHTSNSQHGFSKVNLCSTYPSIHSETYFNNYHSRFISLFNDIGIQNGVLLIAAFYENDEIYVYDPGFRLQGEAPHLLIKDIHGFDQREMLIRFALTGSMGELNLAERDDALFGGKKAATLWFLLKAGTIGRVSGLEEVVKKEYVKFSIQRLYEGDIVENESVGTERQVLTRLYIVCDSDKELAEALNFCMDTIHVTDVEGKEMLVDFKEVRDYTEGVLNGNLS